MRQFSRRNFLHMMGASAFSTMALPNTVTPLFRRQAAKTIHVLALGNPFGVMLPHVHAAFTEKTGITVDYQIISSPEIFDRAKQAGELKTANIDVITVDQIWLGQFVENGWLKALDSYARAHSDTNLDDFIPQVLHSFNTYGGQLWSLPIDTYSKCVIYRRDLFEAQGLPLPPKDPAKAADWTLNKYLETVKALHGVTAGGTKFFGTCIVGSYGAYAAIIDLFSQFTMNYKGKWFNAFPDAAKWDFNPMVTSDENLQALEFFQTLNRYSPPEALDYADIDQFGRFGNQRDIGMMITLSPANDLLKDEGYYSGKSSKVVGLYDSALLPTLTSGGERPVWVGGFSLGIAANSSNPDAAWQYIKWATSAQTQKAIGLIPDYNYQYSNFSRRSLMTDPELIKHYPHLPLHETLLSTSDGKRARPPVSIYTTLAPIYGEQVNGVLKGTVTPENALDNVDIKFRALLSDAKLLPYNGKSYEDTLENTQKLIASLKK